MAEPARQEPVYDPDDEQPVTRPDLRSLEGGGQTTPGRGNLHSVPTGPDAAGGRESTSTDAVGGGASSAGSQSKSSSGIPTKDLRQAEQDGDLNNPNWFNRAKDQKARLGKRFSGTLSKWMKKKWVIGVGIGASGILIAFAFLFFFLGALKIPDFMEHITAYQFTRTTRQFTQYADNVTEEKTGLDSLTAAAKKQASDWFNSRPGVKQTKALWSKFDRFRPNKLISNLDTSNRFKLVYDSDGMLRGVTLNNARTILIDNPTGFRRFVPFTKFKGQVNFASDVAPQLNLALKDANVGPIIRFKVASAIRQRLGISLLPWKIGDYQGKTEAEAKLQNDKDMVKDINNPESVDSATAAISDTTQQANDQLQQDLQDNNKLEQIVANNGADPAVGGILKAFTSGTGILKGILNSVAGILSPVYSVGMPVCLVYDGSAVKGNDNYAKTVNNQTDAQMKTAIHIASAADAIRNGYGASAEAAGALGNRIGQTSDDPSEIRAQTGTVDTTNYSSTESTPSGNYDYTAFNAIFGGGVVGDTASSIANTLCPAITNTGLAIGIGLGNLAACFVPVLGQEGCGDEQLAAQSAKTAMGRMVTRMVGKFATDKAATKTGALASYIATAPKDFIKVGGTIAGATLLTHFIILQRMGSLHNGTQSNTDLGVDSDSGMNNYAQSINQQQFYGRPLTDAEINEDDQDDQTFRKSQTEAESPFERYASLTNPDSLLSRVGFAAMADMKPQTVTSLTNIGSMLLNPLKTFSSLFMSFNSKLAYAASPHTSVNTYYGNVQFGFSRAELKLIATDPSYGALENQEILDDYGQEDQIGTTYNDCFTKQIGDLLESGEIQRDDKGDIIPDQGLCAPDNLSFNNTSDQLANDSSPDSQHKNDMIFRYRVANGYENGTLDQLLAEQDPSSSDNSSSSSTTSTTTSGPIEQGSDAQLAQKLLDYKKTGQYNCDNSGDCTDLQKMVNGQSLAGSDGCRVGKLDNRVLQLMLYVIEQGNFKIGTFALCGDHSYDGIGGHSGGLAVDISSINGVSVATDSPQAKSNTIALDKFLNDLPSELQLDQQISYGYGNHPDSDVAAYQQAQGKLCNSSCVSFYGQSTEDQHENHIHAGF